MSDVAIRVEGLGKQYRIGPRQRYKALRDTVADTMYAPVRGLRAMVRGNHPETDRSPDTIWAVKDVSFEVNRGDVLGVIGGNGAGKSTLLKLLSRITEPTDGTVDIYGRVGSLLEVGTGFNPELTGRENTYLNGAILGMKRAEIARKFDAIVAFAEIEQFLDTPVKRYSTGMYMRLAFSVAAHLESEILLVDEVLAVGDAAFQKKCLGKMDEVARKGRTVLFVSHNLVAVQSLCRTAVWLKGGRVAAIGDTPEIVTDYLLNNGSLHTTASWDPESAPGDDTIRLMAVHVEGAKNGGGDVFSSSGDVFVDLEFFARAAHPALCVGFDLGTPDGTVVLRSFQTDSNESRVPQISAGSMNRWRCTIPHSLLHAGTYTISPRIGVHGRHWIINGDPVVDFEVALDHGESAFWHGLDSRSRPGVVSPILSWTAVTELSATAVKTRSLHAYGKPREYRT
jgi:lipopolysaccharide transport system ATP-binding protein